MRKQAFSIMELILGVALILLALVVFLSVFSSSSSQAAQSRNRTVAILLGNSIFDEMEAHPYGNPAPNSWSTQVDRPVQLWIEGNQQEMDFHKSITPTPGVGNGSFIGKAAGNTDDYEIKISWREGVGAPEPGVVDPKDNKVLILHHPFVGGAK